MTGRFLSIVLLTLGLGAGIGASVTLVVVNTRAAEYRQRPSMGESAQIATLTEVVAELRQQLLAEKMQRDADQQKMKAFNTVPTQIAPPKTYEIGK